ncbi:hypothetical protein ACET3X_006074 [Alternaria dauci]|uniref:Uncharacterized protein n=1 Tax=Alternaria dauci TaxID=48095 RepID=A0ABR3UHJ9_9PLEO
MAPKRRPSKGGKGKETISEDPIVHDPSSIDVEMQDTPREATASLNQANVPLSGFHKRSLPGRSAPPESAMVSNLRSELEYSSVDTYVGPPPGYVRNSGPAQRQSDNNNWPHGVLSGGELIRFLEDLSRSSRRDHWQVSTWLESFAARFGRIHNLDGLVVTNAQDMHMLMLAHKVWLETKGKPAKGDIFWVAGLEPVGNVDPDWEAKASTSLPELSSTYSQKHWTAGEAQYLHGTSIERPRKGIMVYAKWIDGMGWEREIWQA